MSVRPIDANALMDELQRLEEKLDKKAADDVDFQVAYISGIVQGINKRVKAAPTIDYVPRQQWISVKDRLPENGKMAICKTDWFYEIFQWDGKAERWFGSHSIQPKDFVTHWMPLPEPPKEG